VCTTRTGLDGVPWWVVWEGGLDVWCVDEGQIFVKLLVLEFSERKLGFFESENPDFF
jgi:hypothetical protein